MRTIRSNPSCQLVDKGIEIMSVRGVIICETTTSPSSMTPSIISRASSSSKPSRCPWVTTVRISSSNESSSAAAGRRPAMRCSIVSTRRAPSTTGPSTAATARHSGQVKNSTRAAQSRETVQGIHNSNAKSNTAPRNAQGQRAGREPDGGLVREPPGQGQSIGGGREELERLQRQPRLLVAAKYLSQTIGSVAVTADLVQFGTGKVGERPHPQCGEARHEQAGRGDREGKLSRHCCLLPGRGRGTETFALLAHERPPRGAAGTVAELRGGFRPKRR